MLTVGGKGKREDILSNIGRKAYEKYQMKWISLHDCGIKVLSDIAGDWFQKCLSAPDYDEPLSDYISRVGFGGAGCSCYDDFIKAEYQNAECMKELLSETEYTEWCHETGSSMETGKYIAVLISESYRYGIGSTVQKAKEALAAHWNDCLNENITVEELEEEHEIGIALWLGSHA